MTKIGARRRREERKNGLFYFSPFSCLSPSLHSFLFIFFPLPLFNHKIHHDADAFVLFFFVFLWFSWSSCCLSFTKSFFCLFSPSFFFGVSPACALLFFFYLLWTRQNLRINHERFNSWPSLCFVTEGSIGGQCLRGDTHCCGGNTRWTVCRWSMSWVCHKS